jgi:NCAIR mutase (PurE)-related protein
MDDARLTQLLNDVSNGTLTPDDAARELRRLPFADLGFARIDHHRSLRQGLPEAIYAPSKTPEQCGAIVRELRTSGVPVVLSRATLEQFAACPPDATLVQTGETLWTIVWDAAPPREGRVIIVTAGTADAVVAAECEATLRAYGITAVTLFDCGVAGLHRLLTYVDIVAEADVVIAIAGMEGALASVVGGLTRAPVIAVPTSVGYGSSFEGVTALLAMLSSCAAGVAVVGIDNGYGAAVAAARHLFARA